MDTLFQVIPCSFAKEELAYLTSENFTFFTKGLEQFENSSLLEQPIDLEDVDQYLDEENFEIPQLDGQGDIELKKNCFAVNCPYEEIVVLMNFIRSFDIWKSIPEHELCAFIKSGYSCFFCLVRSSCLRLSAYRGKGPKSIKVVEFASEMQKFEDILNWNWKADCINIETFIANTINLLIMSEETVFSGLLIQPTCKQCQICSMLSNNLVIDCSIEGQQENPMKLENVVHLLTKKLCISCSKAIMEMDKSGLIIVKFLPAVSINISSQCNINGKVVRYISHISEELHVGFRCKFTVDGEIVYQDEKANICYETDGKKENVSILALYFGDKSFSKNDSHIYSQKDLKCIDKKYLSVINPDKFEAKRLHQQEYDRNRDKTEERQKRDKSEKRRLMHQELDKN